MFQIHYKYQGNDGVLNHSRAVPDQSFQGITPGLALKYVSHGTEIYLVDGHQIPVSSGNFILLPKGIPFHAISSTKTSITEGYCLDIYESSFCESADFYVGNNNLFGLSFPMWEGLFTNMCSGDARTMLNGLTDVSTHIHGFMELVKKMEAPLKVHAKKTEVQRDLTVRLISTHTYLQQNFCKKIQLDSLARWVGLSKFHLLRLYKDCMGYTPHEFQMHLRMEKARELLLLPRSITSIALEVGFHDSAAFSNQFRKFHHMSPREFRATSI
ncbi:MAG: AraC family transcriptional regulator [Bacteroidota bacterium]